MSSSGPTGRDLPGCDAKIARAREHLDDFRRSIELVKYEISLVARVNLVGDVDFVVEEITELPLGSKTAIRTLT